MEQVLIDAFRVPEGSKAEFLEQAQKTQRFIRTLPGFIEGFLYEQHSEPSWYNYLTTAVWENEEAFENANRAVANEHAQQGFHPLEFRTKLGLESVRATYERTPY